jgi:hypothetical protein
MDADAEHVRYALLADVTAVKQQSCETCKWNAGQLAGMSCGVGNDYPCTGCRVDRWEPIDAEE